jgi:hypothetical protein
VGRNSHAPVFGLKAPRGERSQRHMFCKKNGRRLSGFRNIHMPRNALPESEL